MRIVHFSNTDWARAADRDYVCLGDLAPGIPRLKWPQKKVDPITFSVVAGALLSLAREMETTLRNASLSPIINIGKDFSCALFTADAQLVTQACNCPGHVGSMHFAVLSCLDAFGSEGISEGDMYLLNDPYRGGTHLPDITLIAPIFFRGELLMFAGNRAHHSDVGGSVPGSFPLSREIFEEGVRFPPVKYMSRGRRAESILDILLANVRSPREVEGDLEAQFAANHAGARAFIELVRKFGRDALLSCIAGYLDHSERSFRANLKLPEGVYAAEDWMDGDGTNEGPKRIRAALTVRGTDVYVDFSGTDKQAAGPINSVFATTASMIVTALLGLTDPTIMPNHGFYRPIHVKAPAGTLVNPTFPFPAVGFPDVCNRIVEVLMEALTPVIPERVIAATSGTTTNAFFGGTDPRTGEHYVWYSINSQGGWGGRADGDGWHNVCFIEANGWDIPVETIEYRYPWRVVAYKLRDDSSGAGRRRGGKGNYLALTPIGHDAVFSINGDRAATPPYGIFGGHPGATGRCRIYRADGTVERIAPKMMKADRIQLRAGETIVIEAPSGGGYGDPLERESELVHADVRDGIVPLDSARKDYGVVVDPQTFEVDETATQNLRKQMLQKANSRSAKFPAILREPPAPTDSRDIH
jgi:N-methylhydantoinase B